MILLKIIQLFVLYIQYKYVDLHITKTQRIWQMDSNTSSNQKTQYQNGY